jgi:transposase-like protein
MAQRPDGGKQQRWLELIQRWQRSPITIREFCQRNQISQASFFSWRRVLRERGLLDEPSTPKMSKASSDVPAFVKLSTPDNQERASTIEVVLKQPRRRLRVRPGFDADMLRQLVRLLEDTPC